MNNKKKIILSKMFTSNYDKKKNKNNIITINNI